ncbi:MAG: hypothetical protein HRU09_19215, partial [Oligoflexales bacterium]|nr:hypothetical protein [Oligoflexales bacterium]
MIHLHHQLEGEILPALSGLESINARLGISTSADDLTPLLLRLQDLLRESVRTLRTPNRNALNLLKGRWLITERAYKWPAKMLEYVQLLKLLLSDRLGKEAQVDQIIERILGIKQGLNTLLECLHPARHLKDSQNLRRLSHGDGVSIVVFDLFEPGLLELQRKQYPKATIKRLKSFGTPVAMNHGNSEIDVILTLAPQVTIIPIAASSTGTLKALRHIDTAESFQVLNISRPFMGSDGRIDEAFSELLVKIGQRALISKSMGNSGTDLEGNLSQRRQALGLGHLGDLSAYDTSLIRDFVSTWSLTSKFFFTINADIIGDRDNKTIIKNGTLINCFPFKL